jgi:hypothetical protein
MPELLINQLVQVVVTLKGNDRAVVVPRDAVVVAPGGATTVIVKRAPERFEAVPVSVRPLGGQRVALRASGAAAIADGDRVVVVGAPALSQIR